MITLGTSARTSGRSSCAGVDQRLILVLLGCLVACGSSTSVMKAAEVGKLPRRPTEVTHEPCDFAGAQAKGLDANGDGRADVRWLRTAKGLCRGFDLNMDGGVDSWVYEDGGGAPLRRELDYDRDGLADEIQLFAGGVLVERHRSTTVPGKLDTWHFYESGRIARTERDTNSDGIVDQWWDYRSPECPVIRSDLNSDGKPDARSAIDHCKDNSPAPPQGQGDGKPGDSQGRRGSPAKGAGAKADPDAGGESPETTEGRGRTGRDPKQTIPRDGTPGPGAEEED